MGKDTGSGCFYCANTRCCKAQKVQDYYWALGLLEFSYTDGVTVPQAIKVLKTIHEKNPKSGKELAAIMGVSTGAISQARSQLVKWGYLDGVAKGLIIMPEGYEKLAKTWPTEYADLIKNKKEEDDACPF